MVTLVKSENEDTNTCKVYGLAYEIKLKDIQKTFDYLNEREKCGYSLNEVNFQVVDHQNQTSIVCVCYFADDSNVYYSPENDTLKIAEQIYKTVGPSGPNKYYLFKLCDALRSLAQEFHSDEDADIAKFDAHIFYLETLVKNFDSTL